MKLIDTHQHLWDLRQFPYSWCAGIPTLNRSFALDDDLVKAANSAAVVVDAVVRSVLQSLRK